MCSDRSYVGVLFFMFCFLVCLIRTLLVNKVKKVKTRCKSSEFEAPEPWTSTSSKDSFLSVFCTQKDVKTVKLEEYEEYAKLQRKMIEMIEYMKVR